MERFSPKKGQVYLRRTLTQCQIADFWPLIVNWLPVRYIGIAAVRISYRGVRVICSSFSTLRTPASMCRLQGNYLIPHRIFLSIQHELYHITGKDSGFTSKFFGVFYLRL